MKQNEIEHELEIVCSGMTCSEVVNGVPLKIKDWLLHIFIQTLLQTMALFLKKKILNVIKQWKMYEIFCCIRFTVCWVSSFLQRCVLHTHHTGELGQSFSAHWAPFCTFASTSSCTKGNKLPTVSVPMWRNKRLEEIVAS